MELKILGTEGRARLLHQLTTCVRDRRLEVIGATNGVSERECHEQGAHRSISHIISRWLSRERNVSRKP